MASMSVTRIRRRVDPASGPHGGTLGADAEREFVSARGGGAPLDEPVRRSMEAAFDTDFSGVRVHADARANALNASIRARAFTLGRDVFFASNEYRPSSRRGSEVLAHELTHVVQQTGRIRRRGATDEDDPERVKVSESSGPDRSAGHRLVARADGKTIGSVAVHERDRTAIEVSNLRVAPEHRQHGYGRDLLASAARTGERLGKSVVALSSQDDGSGHLDAWYRSMGFRAAGATPGGHVHFEAPTRRLARIQRSSLAIQRAERDPSQYWRCNVHGPWDAFYKASDAVCPQCGEYGVPTTEAEFKKAAAATVEAGSTPTTAVVELGSAARLKAYCDLEPKRIAANRTGARRVTLAKLLELIDAYDVPIKGTDIVADESGGGYSARVEVIKKIQTALEAMIDWCAALCASADEHDKGDAHGLRLGGIFNAILKLINQSCNNENAKALRAMVKTVKVSG